MITENKEPRTVSPGPTGVAGTLLNSAITAGQLKRTAQLLEFAESLPHGIISNLCDWSAQAAMLSEQKQIPFGDAFGMTSPFARFAIQSPMIFSLIDKVGGAISAGWVTTAMLEEIKENPSMLSNLLQEIIRSKG